VGNSTLQFSPDAPSYEQLQMENAELQVVVGSEATELAELRARLADLEERHEKRTSQWQQGCVTVNSGK
jgi:hypothetical protein